MKLFSGSWLIFTVISKNKACLFVQQGNFSWHSTLNSTAVTFFRRKVLLACRPNETGLCLWYDKWHQRPEGSLGIWLMLQFCEWKSNCFCLDNLWFLKTSVYQEVTLSFERSEQIYCRKSWSLTLEDQDIYLHVYMLYCLFFALKFCSNKNNPSIQNFNETYRLISRLNKETNS